MKHDLAELTEEIALAVVTGINSKIDAILNIPKTVRGDSKINGIALDIAPWMPSLSLSIRITDDWPMGKFRYSCADWHYGYFIDLMASESGVRASAKFSEIYENTDCADLRVGAHLIFHSAAEALLDHTVAGALQGAGLNAPKLGAEFPTPIFEYIVIDPDQGIPANYVDIVLSNRISKEAN